MGKTHGPEGSWRQRARRWLVGVVTLSVAATTLTLYGTGSQTSASQAVLDASGGTGSVAGYLKGNQYLGVYPTATSSLNAFSADAIGLNDYVLLPLATAQPPTYGKYIPDLATSWSIKGHDITIDLRKAAKWQDGSALTSKDVVQTLILDGVNGNTEWNYFSSISTTDSHTIQIDVKPTAQPSAILYQVLTNTYPVSPEIYGQFVTSGLQADLLSSSRTSSSSPAAKALGADLKRLVAFNPKTVIGDGPFVFEKMSSQAVIVKKSLEFWAARKVHVPGIEFSQFPSDSAVWGAFEGQLLDVATDGATADAVRNMRSVRGGHVALPNNYFMFTFAINSHLYPLSKVQVRQAIAYILNRKKIGELVSGDVPATIYPGTPYPTGLPKPVEKAYLSRKQLTSLNQYLPNSTKAAQLMRSAGLHKRAGRWVLPNGKPFTITFDTIAGEEDSITFAQSAANLLTRFGVRSKAVPLAPTAYTDDLEKGNFQMANAYPTGFTPLSTLTYELSSINYSATGRGLGVGPNMTVPGLGKVNVPKTILEESETIGPGAKMRSIVWDWARFVESDVPFLTVTDRNLAVPYSTSRFSDWPSISNPLWKLLGYNEGGGLVAMIMQGYVRPLK